MSIDGYQARVAIRAGIPETKALRAEIEALESAEADSACTHRCC